jgi:hypothetical protein
LNGVQMPQYQGEIQAPLLLSRIEERAAPFVLFFHVFEAVRLSRLM